jgi:putative transposase
VQFIQYHNGEYLSAIFGHKDQVDVHQKITVSAVANIIVVAYRPKVQFQTWSDSKPTNTSSCPTVNSSVSCGVSPGPCRFVFNKALAIQKENHEAGGKFIGYVAMAKQLTEWRNSTETTWLKDAPVHPLQHALKDLEKAYKNFFTKRADFPRFKKKGMGDTFRYPDPKQIKLDQANGRILLPKLGWLRYRNSREAFGELRNVTVIQSGGKWFISVQTRREIETPLPQGGIVGIDMGIVRFATLSDGSYLDPLGSIKKHQHRLAKYQRRMARKVKFSSNWKRAKAKVTQVNIDIRNARKDFLHKASTTISQNHAVVCIEDLQIRNMSKSSKGNAEQPGKQVRQKSGLNRSILDQGWGEFRRQLNYKLGWQGGYLIAVPPQNTSQVCPACGYISAENRQTQAKFECIECGYENNADLVGAINVLERGHRLLACGESVHLGRSMKQEPTEATAHVAA